MADKLYQIRIYKYLVGQGKQKMWSNRFIVKGPEVPINDASLLAVADAFKDFEVANHINLVRFDRMVLSTYEKDGTDPAAVKVIGLSDVGEVVTDGANDAKLLPGAYALKVTLNADYGRAGALYWRYALTNADVNSHTGVPTIAGNAGARFQAAADTLEGIIGSGETYDWVLHNDKYPDSDRTIATVALGGIVEKGTTNNRSGKKSYPQTEEGLLKAVRDAIDLIADLSVIYGVVKGANPLYQLPGTLLAQLPYSENQLKALEPPDEEPGDNPGG